MVRAFVLPAAARSRTRPASRIGQLDWGAVPARGPPSRPRPSGRPEVIIECPAVHRAALQSVSVQVSCRCCLPRARACPLPRRRRPLRFRPARPPPRPTATFTFGTAAQPLGLDPALASDVGVLPDHPPGPRRPGRGGPDHRPAHAAARHRVGRIQRGPRLHLQAPRGRHVPGRVAVRCRVGLHQLQPLVQFPGEPPEAGPRHVIQGRLQGPRRPGLAVHLQGLHRLSRRAMSGSTSPSPSPDSSRP